MRRAAAVLWIPVIALATGCGTKLRDYGCTTVVEARVGTCSEWSCNRKIIVRAVKGKEFSLREFRGAAAFFERLTGIPADTRPSAQGVLPGPRLDRSLAAWDAWLRENPEVVRGGETH